MRKLDNICISELERKLGENISIRTVTMLYTGRLVAEDAHILYLDQATWVADSGRYKDFVEKGIISECEPYPADLIVRINKATIVDDHDFNAPLPRKQT